MIKEAISLSKKINNERKLLIMARTKKNVENATPACKTEEVATEVKAKKTKKAKVIDPQKTSYDVTMWFTQPLLGSAPGDPDIYKKFIVGYSISEIAAMKGVDYQEVQKSIYRALSELREIFVELGVAA